MQGHEEKEAQPLLADPRVHPDKCKQTLESCHPHSTKEGLVGVLAGSQGGLHGGGEVLTGLWRWDLRG